MKPLIGIDFDDILYDFYSTLLHYHALVHGGNYKREQMIQYEVQHLWGGTPQEAMSLIMEFLETDAHHNGPLVVGAKEGIRELQKIARMMIVTSRPRSSEGVTRRLLELHFPGVFEDVVFISHYGSSKGHKLTKGHVCKEKGIQAFVEDALHNAESVASVGVPVVLLDAPWNQGPLPVGVTRVHNWNEIVSAIKKVL